MVLDSYMEDKILHLLLIGDIEESTMSELTQKVFDAEAYKDINEIHIHINSAGGSIVDGFSLIGAMTNSTKKIVTINDGVALSMGAIIFISGQERVMKDYSILMLHNPSIWGMQEKDFEKGTSEQKSLQLFKESLINIIETRTNLTKAQLNKYFNEETWLNAQECKKFAITDKILKTSQKPKKTNKNIFEFVNECSTLISFDYTKNLINKPKSNRPMKEVTNSLGLPNDASEAQIYKAISDLKSRNKVLEDSLKEAQKKLGDKKSDLEAKQNEINLLKNEVAQRVDEVKELNSQLNEYQKTFATNIVENAIKESKLVEDAKEKMIELAQKDIDQFNTLLASIPNRPQMKNLEDEIKDSSKDEKLNWTYLDWSQKDPQGLANLKKANPEKFEKLLDEYINQKTQ